MLHNIFKDICIYFLITLVATKQTSFISVTDMCPCYMITTSVIFQNQNSKAQEFSKFIGEPWYRADHCQSVCGLSKA